MRRLSLIALGLLAALPAAAQDQGGVHMRDPQRNPYAELNMINANRGCPQSSTHVTIGVNKATTFGSSNRQQLTSTNSPGSSGCRPLVSTNVVAGANLALGPHTNAEQTIDAQGPRGLLSTNTFTRGYNIGLGAQSTARQTLSNQSSR
jgi:hypothetical protein